MRRKLLIPALLLGGLAACWLLLLLQRATLMTRSPAAPPSAASAQEPAPASAPAVSVFESAESSYERAESHQDPPDPQVGTSGTYTEQRIEELRGLGMTGDTNSLTTILSELTNRDPAIRQAAVEAAVQFGSRDAVPALRDALGQTDDPGEKVALQKAIDFLKLPPMGELHAPAAPSP